MHQDHGIDEAALDRLLWAQHHAITRGQAQACGLSDRMIQHRYRPGGPWQKLLPGVYMTVTGAVSTKQREMAALLYAGPRSILTGAAAARRHGINVLETSVVDVLIPAELRRKSTAFVRVRRTWRLPAEVCLEGEIRYALPARAVADAARNLRSGRDVRALVAHVVQQQRCTTAMLQAELEQGPVGGSALLRAAVDELQSGVRSVPEGDLRDLLKRGRIAMPVFNARLYDGTALVAVADAWWEEAGVAAEVDSQEYHYPAEGWQRTMRRHDRLVARGVLLLHFTPRQIRTAPEEVAAQIRSALAAGQQRPRIPLSVSRGRR